MVKKTLATMVGDTRKKASKEFQDFRKGSEYLIQGVAATPRNLLNFTKDSSKGYLYQQVFTSAGPYKCRLKGDSVFGEFAGIFLGAAQDAAMILGTSCYLAGSENEFAVGAAAVAGAKIASNIIAYGINWYQSARERSEERENEEIE